MNERHSVSAWLRQHPRWVKAARATTLLAVAAGLVLAGGRRWRNHLQLKENELQGAWTRLSASEGPMAGLNQWIKEREAAAQFLERRLAIENRLSEGDTQTPHQFETLLTLSNEVASARSLWK